MAVEPSMGARVDDESPVSSFKKFDVRPPLLEQGKMTTTLAATDLITAQVSVGKPGGETIFHYHPGRTRSSWCCRGRQPSIRMKIARWPLSAATRESWCLAWGATGLKARRMRHWSTSVSAQWGRMSRAASSDSVRRCARRSMRRSWKASSSAIERLDHLARSSLECGERSPLS